MKRSVAVIIILSLVLVATPTLAAKFTDNGNGTVSDAETNLMWQQAEPGVKKWDEAMKYCEDLSLAGHDDWRLPKIDELLTIVDNKLVQPAVDIKFFPDFPHTLLFFWTSSESDKHAKYKAKMVIFNDGSTDEAAKRKKHYTKCVRSIK